MHPHFKKYPYSIPYKRTLQWYEEDWGILSEWCIENIGEDDWDYYSDKFVFCSEEHAMLFSLKWL